jgi:hypothetical protein
MGKNEPPRASETSSYKKVNVYIRVTFYGWEKKLPILNVAVVFSTEVTSYTT